MSASPEEFTEMVQSFTATDPAEVSKKIDQEEDFVLFIGRETCPYCRKFIPKLYKVVQDEGVETYFIHSQDPDHQAEIDQLRSTYDMPTVPSLLVAKDGSVKTVSDSSLTEDEIREFIGV